ncbi:MAG: ATP-dependent sacrificial sulfur transferase LarE [Anaerovoracaceae bacterium]|jgi:uncharacterized protein
MELKNKRLKDVLEGYGSLAVAFSGGADSTLLLMTARQVLGDRLLAITADSPLFSRRELSEAVGFCRDYNIRHKVIPFKLNEIEGIVENGPGRCYYCKRSLFKEFLSVCEREGFYHLAEGTNCDDLKDSRPGLLALEELSIKSPLRYAGFSKNEVRRALREKGITTWQKSESACLATRIPTGEEVTEEKLKAVELAENALRDIGFDPIRVRHHGSVARIESNPSQGYLFFEKDMAERVYGLIGELGFRYVTLDLLGYRKGSVNEDCQGKQK